MYPFAGRCVSERVLEKLLNVVYSNIEVGHLTTHGRLQAIGMLRRACRAIAFGGQGLTLGPA